MILVAQLSHQEKKVSVEPCLTYAFALRYLRHKLGLKIKLFEKRAGWKKYKFWRENTNFWGAEY